MNNQLTIQKNNYLLEYNPILKFSKESGFVANPSKGEEFIASILKSANILFVKEKSFPDLRKNLLRFDFYLPKMNILIEWDGLQHFEQVEFFQKTKKDFLKGKENDRKKNAYCLAKNIKLIRIPYWEQDNIKNINDILKNPKFIVRSIWHNDNIIKERGNGVGHSY